MTLTRIYYLLLEFLYTHPNWIQLWILNKSRNKNVNTLTKDLPEGNNNRGKVPNQNWGPFRRVPNVRGIEVNLGVKNTLLAAFGIEARFKPTFAYKAYVNYGMNKYMNYQIYRLRRLARSDPKEYFKLMSRLMKDSKVMFIMGLNHVEPRWHRKYPEWMIKRLYKQYVEISLSGNWKALHKRTYIPKANNKKRPLGVPDLVWRIHNHQVANFISLYLEERQYFNRSMDGLEPSDLIKGTTVCERKRKRDYKRQHGFRTGNGTKTAWQAILNIVTKADWVYEFDLSRCFPNIHIKAVSKALRKAKVPLQLIKKLEHLNRSPVKNPEALSTTTKETNEWNKWLNTNPDPEDILINQYLRHKQAESIENELIPGLPNFKLEELNAEGQKVFRHNTFTAIQEIQNQPEGMLHIMSPEEEKEVREELKETDMDSEEDQIEMLRILSMFEQMELSLHHKELYKGTEGDYNRGLPQGLPTSPILTVAALEECFIKKCPWNILMYADDGIIFGNGEPPSEEEIQKTLNNEKYGIELNMEKSRFAKLPDEEINLKFLGMRLKGDSLSAETREGSVLKYDKHDLVNIYDMLDNWNMLYTDDNPKDYPHAQYNRKPAKSTEDVLHVDPYNGYFEWVRAQNRQHFEKLAQSRLFGLIQSRLFQGEWNSDITQCFELNSSAGSWVSNAQLNTSKLKYGTLNVFNSTSIACHDMLRKLSSVAKVRKPRKS